MLLTGICGVGLNKIKSDRYSEVIFQTKLERKSEVYFKRVCAYFDYILLVVDESTLNDKHSRSFTSVGQSRDCRTKF